MSVIGHLGLGVALVSWLQKLLSTIVNTQKYTQPFVNTPFSTTPVFSTPDENNDRGNHDTSPSLIGISDITSPLPTDGQI